MRCIIYQTHQFFEDRDFFLVRLSVNGWPINHKAIHESIKEEPPFTFPALLKSNSGILYISYFRETNHLLIQYFNRASLLIWRARSQQSVSLRGGLCDADV